MEPTPTRTPTPQAHGEHSLVAGLSAASVAIGVALVILGVIALGATLAVGVAAIVALGILLIISGVAEITVAITRRAEGHSLVIGLAGVLAVITGCLLLLRPVVGLTALTLTAGVFFLANGAFRLISAIYRRYAKWGWDVLYGILAILLGLIVVFTWPATSMWLIGTLIGLELVFRGAAFLGIGLSLSRAAKKVNREVPA